MNLIISILAAIIILLITLYALTAYKVIRLTQAYEEEKNHAQFLREQYIALFRTALSMEHPLPLEKKAEINKWLRGYEELISEDIDITEIKKCLS